MSASTLPTNEDQPPKLMDSEESAPSFRSAITENKMFDITTAKGHEGGLFQACMKAIRAAHFESNRIRAVIVIAGLFTDVRVYRDVISIFYLLTKEVESKLQKVAEEEDTNPMAEHIAQLGYHFTAGYEQDLAFLYNSEGDNEWKGLAYKVLENNLAAVAYLERIRSMKTTEELAGAAFVLMGALVIGGGAAAMPRVKARYGSEATHLFQSVAGPGRERRKHSFIVCWDSLAASGTSSFDQIVTSTQACMQGNNDVLSTLARKPWWLNYTIAGIVGIGAVALSLVLHPRKRVVS